MNWRCAIGLHDWNYSMEDLSLETIDRNHEVREVTIPKGKRGGIRRCRRCDKRQRFWSDMEGWGWETLPSYEDVLAQYPKERVEIHEP